MVRLPRISPAGLVDLVCLVYLVSLVRQINKTNMVGQTNEIEDRETIIRLWFPPIVGV